MERSQAVLVFLLVSVSLGMTACAGRKAIKADAQPPVKQEPTTVSRPESKAPAPAGQHTFVDVHFDYDSYTLRSDAIAILSGHAKVLREDPNMTIRIEGHCDERGTVEYNLALGQRRAQAVADYLATYGVDQNRLSIISYGEERPVDPAHGEDAWRKNRRGAFATSQ